MPTVPVHIIVLRSDENQLTVRPICLQAYGPFNPNAPFAIAIFQVNGTMDSDPDSNTTQGFLQSVSYVLSPLCEALLFQHHSGSGIMGLLHCHTEGSLHPWNSMLMGAGGSAPAILSHLPVNACWSTSWGAKSHSLCTSVLQKNVHARYGPSLAADMNERQLWIRATLEDFQLLCQHSEPAQS